MAQDVAVGRAWIWHTVFAVSLLLPTALAAADGTTGPGPRSATVAVAAVWAAAYLVLVQRIQDWERPDRRTGVVYFVAALVLAAVLIGRHGSYFIVVYALYPQAFLFLDRWRWVGVAAVTAVLALGVLPRTDEPGAVLSVLASAGVAAAIGWFVEGVHGQSRQRGEELDDLAHVHAATEAVAAARSRHAVTAALRTHLAGDGTDVALVSPAPAAPPEGGLVVPLRTTGDEAIVVTTTRPLDDGERRRWEAIGPHVGVVLDNLRLAARARSAGVFEERERLAREVHDTLAQSLISIVMQLEAADQALEHDPATSRRHVATAARSARDGLAAARAFVRGNRPDELVVTDLVGGLGTVVSRWRDETSLPAELVTEGSPRPLPAETEAALLRVAQEALANAARHGAARHAVVTLSFLDGGVRLEVTDDGVGFEPTDVGTGRADGSGFGLRSMRGRTESLGGELVVRSAPGQGTTVAATVPTPVPATGTAPA